MSKTPKPTTKQLVKEFKSVTKFSFLIILTIIGATIIDHFTNSSHTYIVVCLTGYINGHMYYLFLNNKHGK